MYNPLHRDDCPEIVGRIRLHAQRSTMDRQIKCCRLEEKVSFRAQWSELRGKAEPDEGGQRRLQLQDHRRVDESHGKGSKGVQELGDPDQ